MLNTLKLYAQYAGASYCNSEAAIGSTISCSGDACPDVTAAGATITATFSYVAHRLLLVICNTA